jgi:hypothetical protein
MIESPSGLRRACLVFDSDSQYFACRNLVQSFLSSGWSLQLIAIGDFEPPHSELHASLPLIRIPDPESLRNLSEAANCDALGVYLPGSKLRQVWFRNQEIFTSSRVRPLLFTGFNGVVLHKFEDGLSWRCGYDLIALNSPEDHAKAISFGDMTGGALMPIIGINRTLKSPTDSSSTWNSRKKIVFAEQVLFPASNPEKFYLYSQLIRLALNSPEWEIVIKPRTLPTKRTFHRQAEHVSHFLSRTFVLPKNLTISYQPLEQLLEDSTALISISSTAFFDAIGLGIPAFTLSDFGVNSAYGTHYFHKSGCTICLSEIEHLSRETFNRRPTEDWLAFKGFSQDFSPQALVAGIEDRIQAGHHHTAPIPVDPQQRVMGKAADIPPQHLAPRPTAWRLFDMKNRSPEQTPATIGKMLARTRRRIVNYLGSSGTTGPKP